MKLKLTYKVMEEHRLPDTVSNHQTQQSEWQQEQWQEPPEGDDANKFLGFDTLNESIFKAAAMEFLDKSKEHLKAMGCATPRK